MKFQDRYEDYGIHGVNTLKGGEQRVKCPECPVRKPYTHQGSANSSKDLAVNAEKGVWLCHRCGWSGNLKKEFIKPVFIKIESKAVPVEEKHYDYFEKARGIPRAVVDRNKITKDRVYIPALASEQNVICFNYFVGEDLVNIKYRDVKKNFCQVKNGAKVFYKLNDIEDLTECIITEGEFDALSFEVAGFQNAISVPDGAINPEAKNIVTKLSYLDNCADYFEGMVKIYLACDNDAPGIRLREELARRLGKSRCWIVNYPEGCKDANDVLIKHGAAALKDCIEKAEPYPVEGIHLASDRQSELNDLFENGYPNGAKTGKWYRFDQKLQFFDSILTVITGIPSHGKSNFLDHLSINLAINAGWKFGVFSPENSRIEIHMHRLLEIVTGKPFLPGYQGRMSAEEKDQAFEFINKNFFFILPDNDEYTFDRILDAASYLVLKQGIKALILDPWNVIEHSYGKDRETDYTEKMLNKLLFFARNHGIHIFIVAHPYKMKKKPGTDKYEIPTLYDIKGSANWYNKAELGISVYREFYTDINKNAYTMVYIQKVKHKYMGSIGSVKFDFETKCQRYYERDESRHEGNYLDNYVELTTAGHPASWEIEEEDIPF